MALLRPDLLRQAVVAHLVAELGPDGWREGAQAYDAFPALEGVAHSTFAVGMLRTDPFAGDRQRASVGLRATTGLGVRFAAVIRPQSAVADYDRALRLEADLVRVLADFKSDNIAGLRIVSIPTRIVAGGGAVFVGETTCATSHVYPLTE